MKRNVVLIVLDTVRQDYFAEYATRLQSMSDVRFTQCRAASSCSVPSHASILTGQLPHQHGIHSTSVDYSSLRLEDTFLSKLPAHRKIGISTNTFAGNSFGFDKFFDDFVDISWTRRRPDGLDAREFVVTTDADGRSFYWEFLKTALQHDNSLDTLWNAASAQLDVLFSKLPVPKLFDDGANAALATARNQIGEGSQPFFLFVNLMEAHTPHQPTRGYDDSIYDAANNWSSMDGISQWEINRNGLDGHERGMDYFRQLYAAAIDYLDRQVVNFVQRVRAVTDNETIFIITSDHGENLGYEADGTLVGHNSSLSEGLLHVPLTIVNSPAEHSKDVDAYFSHLQLGQMIAQVADGQCPNLSKERIAAERITTTNVPDVSSEEQRYWKRSLRCVYEGNRKWVWDSLDNVDEYELDDDRPCWQQLLTDDATVPEWAESFFRVDIKQIQQHGGWDGDAGMDEATRARLEELGYL